MGSLIYLTETCMTVLCVCFTFVLSCEDWTECVNKDKYLPGHVLESTRPCGPQQCLKRCDARTECTHINFHFRDLVCEVVVTEDPSKPSEETEREGYIYILKENTGLCSTLRCSHHSLCYQTKQGLPVCLKVCRFDYKLVTSGLCVKLYQSNMWGNADAFCKKIGGRLSVIDTPMKQRKLYQIRSNTLWVGASKVNNTWQWNTGVQVSTGDEWSKVYEQKGPCLAMSTVFLGYRCTANMEYYCEF